MIEYIWFLLPVAAASGWLAAVHRGKSKQSRNGVGLSSDYYRGLNYLLNEEQDKALDVFLRLAQEDAEAIETHLALGGLYRRRGEIERAIRIHQNLLARPSLDPSQRLIALMELAKDYMHAGLYDRAESLLLDIVKHGQQKEEALAHLLSIYQSEHDWEKAVHIAKKIKGTNDPNIRQMIAHCYCEIAEEALRARTPHAAKDALKEALFVDPKSVRANILLGEIAIDEKRYTQAYRHYIRIFEIDDEFVPEVVNRIVECIDNGASSADFDNYIRIYSESDKSYLLLKGLSKYLMQRQSVNAAREYAWHQLQDSPSFLGLTEWLRLEMQSDQITHGHLEKIYQALETLMQQWPAYQCRHCGYRSTILYWQCPTCKLWGTVKPTVMAS